MPNRREDFWVVLEIEEKVTVDDVMELEDFPLDQQDVHLTVYLTDLAHEARFVEIEKNNVKMLPVDVLRALGDSCVNVDCDNLDTPDFYFDMETPFKSMLTTILKQETRNTPQ